MRNENTGMTPRETAAEMVISWIEMIYKNKTGDLDNLEQDVPPHFVKEVKRHLAKIHDKMLDKYNFDGINLGE